MQFHEHVFCLFHQAEISFERVALDLVSEGSSSDLYCHQFQFLGDTFYYFQQFLRSDQLQFYWHQGLLHNLRML